MSHGRRLEGPVLRVPRHHAAALSGLLVLSALLSGAFLRPRPVTTLDAAIRETRQPLAPAESMAVSVVGPIGTVAAGDTLLYTLTWPASRGAATYDVSWSAGSTNGVWTYLKDSTTCCSNIVAGAFPKLRNTSGTYLRSWISAIPWDSVAFTVQLVARSATNVPSLPYSTTWRVVRRPATPGPITVDSSLIVTGMLLQPPTLSLALGGTGQLCAFAQYHDGAVATQTGAVGCSRQKLWKLPTAAQQAHTDSMCFRWASSDRTKAIVAAAAC